MHQTSRSKNPLKIQLDQMKNLRFRHAAEDNSRSPLQKYQDNIIGKRSHWQTFKYEFLTGFLSGVPGMLGLSLRLKFYRLLLGKIGRNVAIGKSAVFWQPHRIFVGDNSILRDYAFISVRGGKNSKVIIGKNTLLGRYSSIKVRNGLVEIDDFANIGEFCRIGTTSSVRIGSHAMVASHCYIGAGNHRMDNQDIPAARLEVGKKGGVTIGKDVWLGTHVTVLDGVTIGEGSIVGAYSLVNKDIPPNSMAYGIPAKIRSRQQ